ncbi:hypothetical protein BST86_13870 [Nonlabens agnitus]|uniref:Glycoside hydrolase family 19 catalytic domain-containing protein n=2 Tax=Nonlabens agnitus TaxID=870484 RepID=A0A2S9WY77_9FLAO|nr:hypothetical protein BST86_13870 [Nonlabens agnitus]
MESLARSQGITLTKEQKDNLALIIAANNKHNPKDNGSQLAYIIATAWHESKLMPVREGTRSSPLTDAQARAYVNRQGYDYARVLNGHVYYGRGFVQLTWLENYIKMGLRLGYDLENNPDLAMNPKIAAEILVVGMLEGIFTGKKLGNYVGNYDYNDFYQARRVVNHLDRASLIQDYTIEIINGSMAA